MNVCNRDENNSRPSAKIRSYSHVGRPFHFAIGHYGQTKDAHAHALSPCVKKADTSKWLQALTSERRLWDRARAAPRKRSSRKGKCQRRCFTSGNGLTRENISLWRGYVLTWTIKISLLCLCSGVLFVGSTRLEYAGPKTSPEHGSKVLATIKQAVSPTTLTATRTKRP